MMSRVQSDRALGVRLVVALFVAATVSVSACAAACLQVHCLQPATRQAPEHAGHASHSSEPESQDSPSGKCAQHGHPGSYIKDRDASSLDAPSMLAMDVAPRTHVSLPVGTLDDPEGRDHAPSLLVPLYEVDCSLRI